MRRFIYTKNQIADIPQFSVGIAESILNDEYEVQFVYKNRKVILSKEKVYLFDPLKTGDGYPYKVCNVCHRYLHQQNNFHVIKMVKATE